MLTASNQTPILVGLKVPPPKGPPSEWQVAT